ncbi:ABC transporter substrate-binding protein [Bradyrhizobium yuanmingense]|uniref:ABC transporter substrate-binding protein n=1 Tax=Bradyrhizobium yuanmingense TaxID=108015 RepID=A0A0R3CM74_9BRAD|nr:thiamine pyrophosphate-dependent dehydrogenase E1 component subunit alpha [Bradyrhizobium yuanmingense]KRP98759.1 ABC transporter substrate-binding protein [Bradyrhizobium yuanmingense]
MNTLTTMTATAGLVRLHETMCLIREVESTLAKVFADGEVPGFIHLSVGQEAVAAGVVCHLQSGDTLATTHRGHGHVLARGLDLDEFFMEIFGREPGICHGRGGSMHVSDMRLGIIGANGIVGAGIPIALGSALAMKSRSAPNIAMAIFGDGAMAEGVLHESLNFASLRNLPLLLVCENNGWSEFSRTETQFVASLGKLATAFGVPHICVDGNDVEAIAAAAGGLIECVRSGEGPAVLECLTHRTRGHFEGDAQAYRDADELRSAAERDPITLAEKRMREAGTSDSDIVATHERTRARVQEALIAARAAPWPTLAQAADDVYSHAEA